MPPSSTFAMIAAVLVAAGLVVVILRRQRQPAPPPAPGTSQPVARLLAEHVVDMVSTHDPDGTFRYVSPVFAGLVGEYPGMLVGRHPKSLAHPDDEAAIAALWKRASALRGAAAILVWRCRRHNGDYSWLETSARAASRDAAELGAIICASRDVTERKQIEDALRDSEQRFRTAIETVRMVAVGLDANGSITFANDALCSLTGWSRADLIGENWFDKCTPAGDATRAAFLRMMSTGEVPATLEGEIVCRDGSHRTIQWASTILRSPGGEVQGTASLGADITVRRQEDATMRLLQSITHAISAARELDGALQQTLRSLCAATGWAYGEAWLPTADGGRIELASHHAEAGVQAAELTAAGTAHPLAPGEGLPGLAWRSREIEWFHDINATLPHQSPRQRTAIASGFKAAVAVPVESSAGVVAVLTFFMDRPLATDDRHTRMVGVVADQVGALIDRRREQKRYEAELLQARDAAQAASHAKSDFLSRMSHELRTPLNSVIGFANVMRKNKAGRLAAEELEFLDRITSNGRHLLSLVNDVLDIAKVEAGRMTVTKGLVAVGVMLREVVEQLQGQPRPASVDFRAEVPDDLMPLETDGALLRQVLINLAGNALKFTHAGSVVLSADVDGARRPTHIRVRDTGIGIAADRLDAIFEPFEQATEATHSTYGGTGLGLAISKSICDALGFALSVESAVGKGSTFSIGVSNGDRTVPKPDTSTSLRGRHGSDQPVDSK